MLHLRRDPEHQEHVQTAAERRRRTRDILTVARQIRAQDEAEARARRAINDGLRAAAIDAAAQAAGAPPQVHANMCRVFRFYGAGKDFGLFGLN